MIPVNATTACFPGLTHPDALQRLLDGTSEPGLGRLDLTQCQLCPQNHGMLTADTLHTLHTMAPNTQFRLHANVRVDPLSHRGQDASSFRPSATPYYTTLATLSRSLRAPAYTLHAGSRANADLDRLRTNVLAIQACFDIPVGIEGMYPTTRDEYLLTRWDDYQWLLNSDLFFVVDLSHLNIVTRTERRRDEPLLLALLTAPRCLEIHLSDNDGRHDQHTPIGTTLPWWWPILEEARHITDAPILFTEGNQFRSLRMQRSALASAYAH